jgi:hypothetical protein
MKRGEDDTVDTPSEPVTPPADDLAQPASGEGRFPADVHELRPIGKLKICASCLVSNASHDLFCTACGAKLTEVFEASDFAEAAESSEDGSSEVATAVAPPPAVVSPDFVTENEVSSQETWPSDALEDVLPLSSTSALRPDAAHRRATWLLVAALVAVTAAGAMVAVLWRMQASDAQHLRRSLHATRLSLSSTKSELVRTNQTLAAKSSESEKRRRALVQTQDVLAQVDPLLSSVDGVQHKAGSLADRGSTISADAEAFITTVADLVNYMLQPGVNDYGYVDQQVAVANSELDTIRVDESLFSDDNSAYGTASTAFGTKASAFTQSVRALQRQLKGAVAQP